MGAGGAGTETLLSFDPPAGTAGVGGVVGMLVLGRMGRGSSVIRPGSSPVSEITEGASVMTSCTSQNSLEEELRVSKMVEKVGS
jgi:hypothetical protein